VKHEWQVRVVARGVDRPNDTQFELLNEHIHGVIRYEDDDRCLELAWNIRATSMPGATKAANNTVAAAMMSALGQMPDLRELHVIAAEDAPS
jgi:hypothetical protein